MGRACVCESCGELFKPTTGHVELEYRVCTEGNSYQGFSPADGYSDSFPLCLKCSAKFLKFIDHENEREAERAPLREQNVGGGS